MSANLFSRFLKLIPTQPLQYGEVIASAGGQCIVEYPGGQQATVRGDALPGQFVYFRDGAIESQAPALPVVSVEL